MENINGYMTAAIILAAGCGNRMNSSITKQRMTVGGETVLHRAARAFEECRNITDVVVVTREDERAFVSRELFDITKLRTVIVGGETRADSARVGFEAIPRGTEFVAIHDAARCLITPDMISRVLNVAYERGAATASAPVFDTVKTVNSDGRIVCTPPRDSLRLASTPQVFRTDIYRSALDFSSDVSGITDDNMLVERIGIDVFCVDIGTENIKITTPQDVKYAEMILEARKNV